MGASAALALALDSIISSISLQIMRRVMALSSLTWLHRATGAASALLYLMLDRLDERAAPT
ncbi:hypothetical protein GCM10007907_34770 [Chitinimonas prasina]|uniref:Uncharacterized protein n=1 Tax=Chitinimonas prasina TaxID=1434937 RepID=A0ABQ5YI54_9NEIS|nr:hypothetical protein GCM10007907_34770 [Chitinimonas prasina]